MTQIRAAKQQSATGTRTKSDNKTIGITNALIKDSLISNSKDSYLSDNKDLYNLCIPLWMKVLEDLSGNVPDEIQRYIYRNGLIPTIKIAGQLADSLIQGLPLCNSVFSLFLQDLLRVNEADALRKAIFGLRFLKRISPKHCDALVSDGIACLHASNNACKLRSRKNDTIIDWQLSSIVRSFFKESKRTSDDIIIPTGAVYNSKCKSLAQKLLSAEEYFPLLLPNLPGQCAALHDRLYDTRVEIVPKSYKAVRVIAIEEVSAQIEQQRFVANFFSSLTNHLYPIQNMDTTDQYRNREFARIGSSDGSLATLDLSSASDSVSVSLVLRCLPSKLAKHYLEVRSRTYSYDGKTYLSSISSTMGSRITFPIETMIFYAIALQSVEIFSHTVGLTSKERIKLINGCSAFGDDIIVPTECAELCIQLLIYHGFRPNTEKSFFDPLLLYRESCGEEYFQGVNISSKYFPRRILPDDTIERVNFLVALQHKLVDYRKANSYLVDMIYRMMPKMTESYVGSSFQDVWSYYPITIQSFVSRWEIISNKLNSLGRCEKDYASREKHYCSVTKYDTSHCSKMEDDAYQRYAYYSFLKYGPYYEDEISKLLGISSIRISKDAFVGRPSQAVQYLFD